MNMLNSIIIEGTVSDTVVKDVNGLTVATFKIDVERHYKNANGENVTEISRFEVETYGNMAEIVQKMATDGRGVRVVGRLKQVKWFDGDDLERSKVVVIAEHLEFKPQSKESKNAD